MKKALLPPLAVLAAVFAFALWNSAAMETHTTRWQGQLHQAQTLAETGDWTGAQSALAACYDDWSRQHTYLHVVLEHAAVDDAEAMYRRASAFAAAREPSEFRAELADLSDQLGLLAEMEEFSVQNVL